MISLSGVGLVGDDAPHAEDLSQEIMRMPRFQILIEILGCFPNGQKAVCRRILDVRAAQECVVG
jgi:hypothetical protein